jgi:hypothetical protein
MDLADQIEHLLCARGVSDMPEHFVLPHYSGYSIANLAPTVAHLMGVRLEGKTPPLPEHLWADLAHDVKCVVLLVIDAVGYRHLRRFLEAESSLFNRLSVEGRLVPITSVFPSTTVSALTSIWTGQPPLGHGFLGTKLLLPQQGVLANMLKMAPAAYTRGGSLEAWGWDSERFVTAPSLGGQLKSAGVDSVAHTRLSFIGSSLTQIFLRGMEEVRGYVGLSDLWLNLRRTLAEREPRQRLFVDAYWGGIDNVGHVYGPKGAYLPSALRHLARSLEDDFLGRLPGEARKGTLLVITADHGQIATPSERVVRLPEHPRLQETLLLPPAGESRAAYLYVRPGQNDALQTYVTEHLADDFVLLDTERALEIGLFGQAEAISPDLRVRLGDMVLIAKDASRLTTREKKGSDTQLRGHHGSLTPEEMLVPLLMVRLDQL